MRGDLVKIWLLTAVLVALIGCTGGQSALAAGPSPPAVVNAPAAATTAPACAAGGRGARGRRAGRPTATPEPERQKAEVGMGRRATMSRAS